MIWLRIRASPMTPSEVRMSKPVLRSLTGPSSQPLQVWKDRLATQEGQWDVVNKVSEVLDDVQVIANRFAQRIDYGNGHSLSLIASPIQFDRTPPTLSPAPGFAADTDAVLGALGWDMEAILEAKISGAVV